MTPAAKQLPHSGSCADVEAVLINTTKKLRAAEADLAEVQKDPTARYWHARAKSAEEDRDAVRAVAAARLTSYAKARTWGRAAERERDELLAMCAETALRTRAEILSELKKRLAAKKVP